MKKLNKTGLMKKLDRLIKEIVFIRDGHCVTCPLWREIKPEWKGTNVMQPGHFITRGAKTVRWDLRNVYEQCSACNFIHEYHPEIFGKYVLGVLGKKKYDELIFDGNQNKPSIHMWELKAVEESLEGLLDSMKDNMTSDITIPVDEFLGDGRSTGEEL